MTKLLQRKRDQEREQSEKSRKARQKKVKMAKVAILTATILVTALIVLVAYNTGRQRHLILGTPPSKYQTGLLVNNETKTFAFDGEWNFNFTPGSNVEVKLLLTGGGIQGVQVTFGTISAFNVNPFTGAPQGPFVLSGLLRPSSPDMQWNSGSTPLSGAYRLELVNLGDESNVCAVQGYVNAS